MTTNLNFEAEVLLQVLDNHDEEGQLDSESGASLSWAGDVDSGNL